MRPYIEVARACLSKPGWFSYTPEEIENKLNTSTDAELESEIYAVGSMTAAAKQIQNYLKQIGIELTDEEFAQFKEAVLHGSDNAEIFKIVGNKIKSVNPYDLMMTSLTNVHDKWVQTNPPKFLAREKKHQHMPIELIGWNEVTSDLIYLKPILEASGIEVNEETLKATYYDTVKKFFKARGIKNEADLAAKIPEIASSYHALEGQNEILEKLNDPEFVTTTLMPQIKEKGVGSDLTFIVEATKSAVTKDGFDNASKTLRENCQERVAKDGLTIDDSQCR